MLVIKKDTESLKYLIVNADDFGLTDCVNDGIIHGHVNGIITSTTILPGGSAFENGMKLLQKHSTLGVGVHLTLNEETPISNYSQIPHLVDKNGKFISRNELILKLFANKIPLEEIRKEWTLQIEKCLSFSLPITHLDSHGHIHLFPSLSEMLLQILEKFNINKIRYPVPEGNAFLPLNSQKAKIFFLKLCGYRLKNILKKKKIFSPHFFGIEQSGNMNSKHLIAILKKISKTVSEIMVHPGFENSSLAPYHYWKYNWENELNALTDPNIKTALKEKSIKLINYGQIPNEYIQ